MLRRARRWGRAGTRFIRIGGCCGVGAFGDAGVSRYGGESVRIREGKVVEKCEFDFTDEEMIHYRRSRGGTGSCFRRYS